MCRAYHSEVPAIQCCDAVHPKALCSSDHGRVDSAQGKVVVVGDQLDNACPIIDCNLLRDQDALGEVRNEMRFSFGPETCGNKIGDFGDHQDGDEECAAELLQEFPTFAVMTIVRVESRVERTGVDQEGYRENSR